MQDSLLTDNQNQKINKFLEDAKKLGFFDLITGLQTDYQAAEVYLVGGAVRDILLDKPTKDYDFVVRNVPADELEKFLEARGWVELLGKNFGVFKFIPKGLQEKIDHKIEPFDIALPRTEFSLHHKGGYKDFEIQSDHTLDIKDDLSRRDFTINAFAVKILADSFEFIDEFGGLQDLANKNIRAIGRPQDRFKEDYSRMLRGIRFACQLGFEIDQQTKKSIKKLIKNLNDEKDGEFIVPREIIAREFMKALTLSPVRAFDLFDELEVFKVLIPEMLAMKKCQQPQNYHTEGDVWEHTRLCLEQLESDLYRQEFAKIYTLETDNNQQLWDSDIALAILLHDIDKPTTQIWVEKNGEQRMQFYNHDVEGAKTAEMIINRLRLSSPEKYGVKIKNVMWLIERHILLIPGKIDKMKATKVEKYFLTDKFPGEKLLKVIFVDAVSTVQAGRKTPQQHEDLYDWIALQGYQIAKERITAIKKIRKSIPQQKSFLTGHEIMNLLQMKPGKEVGQVLEKLREAELDKRVQSKEEAEEFVMSMNN